MDKPTVSKERLAELKEMIETEFGYSYFLRVMATIYRSQVFILGRSEGALVFRKCADKFTAFAESLARFE